MKTLKNLTVLGALLLLAGAANAQVRTAPALTAPAGTGNAPSMGPTRSASTAPTATARPSLGGGGTMNNDSYVQQIGDGQMADVEQRGSGRNTADINQSPSSLMAAGSGGNYAKQLQISTGSASSADQNNANIRQHGSTSTAMQEQTGIRNKAVIQQGNDGTSPAGNSIPNGTISRNDYASQKQTGNDHQASINQHSIANLAGNTNNSATQEQSGGDRNNAKVSQEYSNHISVQKQVGSDNSANVTQRGMSNYANQLQTGNRNAAVAVQIPGGSAGAGNQSLQTQTGDDNRADVMQRTGGNFAEQLQTGNLNYAKTEQGGMMGADAGHSVITQQGNSNITLVKQGNL